MIQISQILQSHWIQIKIIITTILVVEFWTYSQNSAPEIEKVVLYYKRFAFKEYFIETLN